MEASVRLIKPQITLAQQLKRNPGNRGKDCPLIVTSRLGYRVKGIKVVGNSLSQIRENMFAEDAKALKASSPPKPIPEISIRRQLARIERNRVEIEENEDLTSALISALTYCLRSKKGHFARAGDALGKSAPELKKLLYRIDHDYARTYELKGVKEPTAFKRLDARVKTLNSPSLTDFGKVVELILDRKRKVLIGLEVSKLDEQFRKHRIHLDRILNRRLAFVTSDRGILTNLLREEAEGIVAEINREFSLKLGFPDEKTGESIARELTEQLLANLIFWFYNQREITTVGNMIIKNINPMLYPQFGGVVLVQD
ncbi:hypothetical protein AMJ44_06320 [candidate division WOR-1 bacterium DG_54_3]|uniref:Uncharacterized protein n=1 Tax=candidate division WOR-1 bacterium DG_54_3 TaxID=1703775 RepID=A0A0S7Y298_UNCSA|nr:MAG: hypothetical protein AMJ44_06320 [candidate division WOR-1 bacterium DG_54_3]